LALILIAVVIGVFISRQLTRPLVVIQDKIKSMDIKKKAEKIVYNRNDELGGLIREYNRKVDELSESALKLAQSEREMAWREMAKQIAHEIKNPLTPMKLSVQYLERAYDLKDENWEKTYRKVNKTLIEQIDILSAIASEFSNFAKMPAQQNETLNVVSVIELSLEIFNEAFISLEAEEKEIITIMDRTQLIRIITNLVKNAIQAIPDVQIEKQIYIKIVT
jgi:nitrogen fixation/metabolism regulation signal transduction histidine kinase